MDGCASRRSEMRLVKAIVIVSVALIVSSLSWVAVDFVASKFKGGDVKVEQRAIDNTQANMYQAEFVEGCTEDGTSSHSYCTCAYRTLLNMYPDFPINEARINRILSDGYNQREVDAVYQCKEDII